MSNKQHTLDEERLPGRHKQASGTEGGACLNRHVPDWNRNNSCSHRWQGYERAVEDNKLYNWPRYRALAESEATVHTAQGRSKKGNLFPPWYQEELAAPRMTLKQGVNGESVEAGDWDLDHGDNFQSKCYRPYWHEANHVIPNSSLQKAIAEVGADMHSPGRVTRVVRGRLLEAGYNLNHKGNMILLPMDAEVARALGLPRHRQTAFMRSHRAYSINVEKELKRIFADLKEAIREHIRPSYQDCRTNLENLSKHLYKQIVAAGEQDGTGSLDEMDPGRFQQPDKPPRKQKMDTNEFN